jgi:hypothetical protein
MKTLTTLESGTETRMPSYGRIDREYAAHLATCPTDQDAPIFMVNFMKYHARAVYADGSDRGLTGKDADDAYAPLDVLTRIGALVVFFADVEPGGEWDRVGIVRYPSRRAFVEMQSRQDFQDRHIHKAAGMERTIVCGTLPEGVRAPGGHTQPRVVFEMVTSGTPLELANAGRLRVEGTILGDGRRFAWLGVSWVGDDVAAPPPSANRVTAVTRPTIDRLAGELVAVAPPSPSTWS